MSHSKCRAFEGRDCSFSPVQVTNPDAVVIVVTGGIGAGKSTLLDRIKALAAARGKRVVVVREPVEQWLKLGILQKFYEDPVRYGYTFQTIALSSRVDAMLAAVREEPAADVYIIERSPPFDQVFMYLLRGVVSQMETDMYETWCNVYRLVLPFEQDKIKVLYLKPSLDTCMDRVAARAREGEIAAEAEVIASADESADTGCSSAHRQAHIMAETVSELLDQMSASFHTKSKQLLAESSAMCVERGVDALKAVQGLVEVCVEDAVREVTGCENISAVYAKEAAKKHQGTAKGGVSRDYQERLLKAHENFLYGKYSDEFYDMPSNPYKPENIVEVGPELADRDFRQGAPGSDEIVNAIVKSLGI